jgi:CMP-2-keto-3-deoxyoctulosonic acid synthetase
VADQLLAAVNSAPERTIIINVQEVLTPIYRLSAEKLHNPNVVKVLLAADGRELFFPARPCPTCAMR